MSSTGDDSANYASAYLAPIQSRAAALPIIPVSTLVLQAQAQLESNFSGLWVEGELSNVVIAASGHAYFTLKDEYAQLRCACFRSARLKLSCELKQGARVVVYGRASIYPARGDFQFLVTAAQYAGEGALQRAFLLLKKQLAAAGLFADEHKKSLPEFPKAIAVVCSAQAAAWQDIIKVCKRRFPAIPLILYPAAVQGKEAAPSLCKAIAAANAHAACDVLLLARGGGSLEDLWAFNEESVAQAVFASKLPVVTGVGHQSDFTIVDFVADCRAATPSAAAEMITPDATVISSLLSAQQQQLQQRMQYILQSKQQSLLHLQKCLRHPGQRLQAQHKLLLQYQVRLVQAMRYSYESWRQYYTLQVNNLINAMQNLLNSRTQDFQRSAALLEAVSPLQILARGYAWVSDVSEQQLLTSVAAVRPGDCLHLRMHDGQIKVKVEQVSMQDDAISGVGA